MIQQLLRALLILACGIPLVRSVELNCESNVLIGNYTVSQDLTCPQFNVNISTPVYINVLEAATIKGVRFVVLESSTLTFGGANLTLADVIYLGEGGKYVDDGHGGCILTNGTVIFQSSITFIGNTAYYGGAVYVGSQGTAIFEADASFSGNNSTVGGGVHVAFYGLATFKGPVLFTDNYAFISHFRSGGFGGAVFADDGGVVTFEAAASFLGNKADGLGGAVTGYRSFLDSKTPDGVGATVIFEDSSMFLGNSALFGGSFFVGGTTTFKAPAVFEQNESGLIGGAIVVGNLATLTFEGYSTFLNNHAGDSGGAILLAPGGILTCGGSASFANNSAVNAGGAVLVSFNVTATFESHVSFVNNSGYHAGAIFIGALSPVTFEDSTEFLNNSAVKDGGAVWVHNPLTFVNSTFIGNKAGRNGGAVYINIVANIANPRDAFEFMNVIFTNNAAGEQGGAICANGCDSMYITEANMVNNSATDGGAISSLNCALGWFNSTATNNVASGRGGALLLLLAPPTSPDNAPWLPQDTSSSFSYYQATYTSSVVVSRATTAHSSTSGVIVASSVLSNIQFQSNTAGSGGGSILVDLCNVVIDTCTFMDGTSGFSAGGVYLGSFLEAQMTNCIFDTSTAAFSGGCIYVGSGTVLDIANTTITNSTSLAGAGGAIYADNDSQVTLTNCTIQQSEAASYGGGIGSQTTGVVDLLTSSITDSESGCCFLDASQYYGVLNATCSDIDFSGTNIYDCCLPDQYWNNVACAQCDSNTMECASVGTSVETLPLKATYWRATNYTNDIRKCLNPSACDGGDGGSGFAEGAQYCAEGYTGPYCAVCANGYFSSPGRTCTKCNGSLSIGVIIWCSFLTILFLCVLGIITAHLVSTEDSFSNELIPDTRLIHFSRGSVVRYLSKLRWGCMRIPIVAAQIVSQTVAVTGVTLPSYYQNFLAWASFFSFDFSVIPSVECYLNTNFYDRLLFVTLVPMFGTLYLCMTYAHVVCKERRVEAIPTYASTSGDVHRLTRLEKARSKHFQAFLILTFLVYSTVSATVFQTFAWEDVQDYPAPGDYNNYSYLRVDYSLNANTPLHTKYVIYAAIMVIIYPIGIPALYAYILWRCRDPIISKSRSSIVSGESTESFNINIQTDIAPSYTQMPDTHAHTHTTLHSRRGTSKQEHASTNFNSATSTNPSSSTYASGQSHAHAYISASPVTDSAKFLYSSYVPFFFYWEVMECVRRLCMTGLVVFLFPGTAAQISLTCLLALGSIVVICIYRPHSEWIDRALYISGALLVYLTMYVGLNMMVDVGNETHQSQAAFSALLITLHIGMTVAALINMCLVAKATVVARQDSFISGVVLG